MTGSRAAGPADDSEAARSGRADASAIYPAGIDTGDIDLVALRASEVGGAVDLPAAQLAAADPAAVPVDPAAPLLNAANALTALRLVLVPVFAALTVVSELTHPGWRIAAALTFGAASITDYVDGWVARRHNLVTAFGKVADPIADKALTGTALVLLSLHDLLPWWMTGLILTRELGITALRFGVLRHGVIPASPGGKLKTFLQSLAIGWILWPLPEPIATGGLWLAYAATAITVGTGVDYVARAVRLRRAAAH
jgi:CDP-diacylglycerol---glycerol-3-phosphate 3-phosphatidyltransferase